MSQIALIRRPSPKLNDGIVNFIEKVDVDLELALEQWNGYTRALRNAGWTTVDVEPAQDCPDSVFVEDTVVMYKNVAVLTRSGAESRRPEIAGTKRALEEFTVAIAEIRAPGTLDGGDVLKVGNHVYVGRSTRTNAEGVRQLRAILTPLGARVTAVPVSKVLHLKTGASALPDGTIIGHPDTVDDPRFFANYMEVPDVLGTTVLCLSETSVLMSASAPKTAALIRDRGYDVFEVPMTEFEKVQGSATCMSVRIRDLN